MTRLSPTPLADVRERDPIAAIYRTITDAKANRSVHASPLEAAHAANVDAVRASVLRLSLPDQMAIVHALAKHHSEYAGFYDLVTGAESIVEEFYAEEYAASGPDHFESERQVWS